MRRTTALLFVLALFIVSATSALAHEQKITDARNDAVDYSDDPHTTGNATPLDFRSVVFSETVRNFIVTVRMHQAVSPDDLCEGACAISSHENNGSMEVDIFKGQPSAPKAFYFIIIAQVGGELAAGLFDSEGNAVSGLTFSVRDDARTFILKVARKKVRGYPKGAKLKWIASSAYATDANGEDCVPNETSPYFGNCWDFVPSGGVATHTLRS